MATKKTAIFTLTERVTLSSTAVTSATIDLSSYVDVGDRQGIQIHSVDYITQGTSAGESLLATFAGDDAEVQVQVMDLNRGGLVFANDRALVSSMRLRIDNGGGIYEAADMFPDNYGKGSDDGRFVVNEGLFIEAKTSHIGTNESANITVRVNASIVTLSSKDFMSLAIASTAADN